MELKRFSSSGMKLLRGGLPRLLSCRASRLYLNPERSHFGPCLRGALVMDHIHPQPPRVLQIQRAVIDEHAFLRRPLGYFERNPENLLLRFSRVQVTRAEKDLELLAQAKRLDPVVV